MKAVRQIKKRTARNLLRKQAVKKAVKATAYAIQKGEKDLVKLVQEAQQALDKAAKVGALKKKTASRKLSRLMKKVNALKKSPA